MPAERLGVVQEGTQNELAVWIHGSAVPGSPILVHLRGAGGKLLTRLSSEQAERLAQFLRWPPARPTAIAGLLVQASAELVAVRDGQGNPVTYLGRRAAQTIAAWLVQR